MMREEDIRRRVHRAVEAHSAHVPDDPHLAARLLALDAHKEAPIVEKKLSLGAVLLIALLLATLTAVAVGLNAYDVWQQSFEKMNTTGELYLFGDPKADDMPLEEALAIARAAIQEKYGTPDDELDAMGLYPTFIPREDPLNTGEEPDEWRIFYSAVTGQNIDWDYREYGVDGEYRVYINGETKEVTYCHWYTENFWARAQRIWDHGNHDLVYGAYVDSMFYSLTPEEQAHFEQLFRENGYEVRDPADRYTAILKNQGLTLLFRRAEEFDLDPEGDQIDAAWQVLEERYSLPTELLKKYFFQASRMGLNTGTDDIVICYNYENEFAQQDNPDLDPAVDDLGFNAKYLGFFLISFRPGTTEVETVTHLPYSVWDRKESVTEGPLLQQNDWDVVDLLAFDEAVEAYSGALRRLKAAEATNHEFELVKDAVHRDLGDDPAIFDSTSDEYDVYKWFSDETSPEHSELRTAERTKEEERERLLAEVQAQHGADHMLWPLHVQAQLMNSRSDRKEGELTREEAIEKARAALIEQKGDVIGENWLTGAELRRDVGEGCEWSQWLITFCSPTRSDGWWVHFYDTGASWQGTEITITSFADGIG